MKTIIHIFLLLISVFTNASSFDQNPANIQVKQKESADRLFRIQIENTDGLEGIFKSEIPGETFNRSANGFDIYFTLSNDLSLLRVFKVAPKDDDFGYTHGYAVSGGKKLENDQYLRFEYTSDLYTRPLNPSQTESANAVGEVVVKQFFVNDNIARFVLDNINEGKLFYWRGEFGWEKLDNRQTNNAAQASRQQELLHNFLNRLDPGTTKKPVYVTEAEITSEGLIVGAYVGLQKYFKPIESCGVGGRIEIGHRENQIKDADYSEASAFGSAICQQPGSKSISYRLDVGVQNRLHDEGRQEEAFVDISVSVKTWRVGIKVEKIQGELHNYMKYNLPNIETGESDSTTSLYFHKKF